MALFYPADANKTSLSLQTLPRSHSLVVLAMGVQALKVSPPYLFSCQKKKSNKSDTICPVKTCEKEPLGLISDFIISPFLFCTSA